MYPAVTLYPGLGPPKHNAVPAQTVVTVCTDSVRPMTVLYGFKSRLSRGERYGDCKPVTEMNGALIG